MNQNWCPGECAEESAHLVGPEVAAEDHQQHNEQAEYQKCILESFHFTPRFENPFTTVTYQTATACTLGAGSPVATGMTASPFFFAAAAAAVGAVR
jgi:hypothetical protein